MMTSSNGNIFRVIDHLCWRIHRSLVNSPHKGQWRGALMFSLISTRINGWGNNDEAGDLRRHRAHYDVTVMRLNALPGMSLLIHKCPFCYIGENLPCVTQQISSLAPHVIHLDGIEKISLHVRTQSIPVSLSIFEFVDLGSRNWINKIFSVIFLHSFWICNHWQRTSLHPTRKNSMVMTHNHTNKEINMIITEFCVSRGQYDEYFFQEQVLRAGTSNYIPHTVGCNYLSLHLIHASGETLGIYLILKRKP